MIGEAGESIANVKVTPRAHGDPTKVEYRLNVRVDANEIEGIRSAFSIQGEATADGMDWEADVVVATDNVAVMKSGPKNRCCLCFAVASDRGAEE